MLHNIKIKFVVTLANKLVAKMKRNQFLKSMAILPFAANTMKLSALNQLTNPIFDTEKMPVLFLGHGSPMNAIEENEFVSGFRNIGKTFQKPNAILCISAHWETNGTFVTAMNNPKTIHDFGGFPKALYDVEYPAPGSPDLALETKNIIKTTDVGLDDNWGLDHGAWSVIKHLYPDANVPVIQMSIDYSKPPQYHYDLGKQLSVLRNKGVLIVGSGNIVHNLGLVAWDKINVDNYAHDWASEAKTKLNQFILEGNHQALIDFRTLGRAVDLAIPSTEHYLPLLYSLALQDKNEQLTLFNDKALGGSLSMTSVKIG